MSDVKVKKLPTLEQDEFRQCGNCVHKTVCSIYEGAYLAMERWNKEFGNEISGEDIINEPAEFCKHFIPVIGMKSKLQQDKELA